MNQFYLYFPTMPKSTAQQKRYNGRTRTFFKDARLMETEREFYYALRPHAPEQPSEFPIRLSIFFYFDIKEKKKWGKVKDTKPDVDNFSKAFIDQMTKAGFWGDDSQIVSLHLEKYYSEKATIVVRWEEVNGRLTYVLTADEINNAQTVEPYCYFCGQKEHGIRPQGEQIAWERGYECGKNEKRPQGECKSCRHRDPEDKKCDCGGKERQGCLFPVSDDYYCKYYEKGGAE